MKYLQIFCFISDEGINGKSFLALQVPDMRLMGMKMGPAIQLMEHIKQCKGEVAVS